LPVYDLAEILMAGQALIDLIGMPDAHATTR
jgi:hypothetical protein